MQGIVKPAILYKDIITQEMNKKLYTEDWFYYRETDTTPFSFPESKNGRVDWAFLDNHDRVVGYLCYYVDLIINSVNNFGLMGFVPNSVYIGAGLHLIMEKLVSQYHRIEWGMIGGNPIERHYDKFVQKYHGRKIELRDTVKDFNGKYRNSYIYEIINSEV